MDAKTITELGATGVILFAFTFMILKGIPAIKAHVDGLVAEFRTQMTQARDAFRAEQHEARTLFKEEIAAEREVTKQLIADYGSRLDRNTQEIGQLRESLEAHVKIHQEKAAA